MAEPSAASAAECGERGRARPRPVESNMGQYEVTWDSRCATTRTFVDIVDPVRPKDLCPREGGMFWEAPTDAGACVARAHGRWQLNRWQHNRRRIICHGWR